MYCPKCGKEVPDKVFACIFCGYNLSSILTPNHHKNSVVRSTPFNPETSLTNTSGSGDSTIVPEEIKGWSWVGFLWCQAVLPWVWGWTYLYSINLTLPIMTTVISFIIGLIIGNRGREIVWRNQHWKSINQFKFSRFLWTLLWFIFMAVSMATIIYTVNRLKNSRIYAQLAKDTAAYDVSSQLVAAINRYYLNNNRYPWDGEIVIPDYFTTSVGKEVWLATLVAEGELMPSFISNINRGTNLVLFNNNSFIQVCYLPVSKVNRETAKNLCLNGKFPTSEAIPLCKSGSEYQCLPQNDTK